MFLEVLFNLTLVGRSLWELVRRTHIALKIQHSRQQNVDDIESTQHGKVGSLQ
jgi:hypothetical protein